LLVTGAAARAQSVDEGNRNSPHVAEQLMPYRHTQIGWVVIGAVVVAGFMTVPPLHAIGFTAAFTVFAAVGLAVLLCFFGLTVTVDDHFLEARFGIGLLKRRAALNQIRSFTIVRNPWYYGWGYRFIPRGRLYNISGLSAVELVLSSGMRLRVGSDEPEALVAALAARLGPSAQHVTGQVSGWRGVASEGAVLVVILGPVVFVLATLVYLGLRPPVVSVLPSLLSVRSGLHGDEIAMANIDEVTLEYSLPQVLRRTNGFALGATLRGRFELEGVGDARLFIRRDAPPFVKVQARGRVLYIGFRDPKRTLQLYEELTGYRSRE